MPSTSSKTTPLSPALPPEIWRLIFRFATELPGLLDTSPLPSLCDDQKPWSFEWTTTTDLVAKSSLTLVCSQWYSLAIEFLYEYVRIETTRTLLHLTQSLEANIETAPSNPLGWHIKRLYLDLESVGSPHTDSISRLLRLCPDVRCINLAGFVSLDPPLDLSALVGNAPSLRACSASFTACYYLSPQFIPFFKELQQFDTIAFLSLSFPNNIIVSLPEDPISLYNLHTIKMMFVDHNQTTRVLGSMTRWNLPSLRSVTSATSEGTEPHLFDPFFRSHGAKITTLVLEGFSLDMPIASMIRYCPRVIDLTFGLRRLHEPFPSVPEVRRINLAGEANLEGAQPFDTTMGFIFANVQPKLECIRLRNLPLYLTPVSSWFWSHSDQWKVPYDKWIRKKNLRLESAEISMVPLLKYHNGAS
jgi:hypothetical protein